MDIDLKSCDKRALHELFTSAIVPRPIAWVSTVGQNKVFNVAPFSCFMLAGLKPAVCCLQITWRRDRQKKDTLRNIEFSRDFVVGVVTEDLVKAMNQTCYEYPPDVSEFKECGLTPVKSSLVKAPLIAESPVNMECRVLQVTEFGECPTGGHLIIGEVVAVHIKDELWDGEKMAVTNDADANTYVRRQYRQGWTL